MKPWENLKAVRDKAPLVDCIINMVSASFAANGLIAVGAQPCMANESKEMQEMTNASDAISLNIGTIHDKAVDAMIIASNTAKEKGIPVVLDPVGNGASKLRTRVVDRLLEECPPSIIRGNGSEIAAIAAPGVTSRGVDSIITSDAAVENAFKVAKASKCIVAVSGNIDYITDGKRVFSVQNGHPLMAKVTSVGCLLGCVVAAFAAVHDDHLEATVNALVVYGVAGEMAAARSFGTGSMYVNLLDALSNVNEADVRSRAKVSEVSLSNLKSAQAKDIDLSLYFVTDKALSLNREVAWVVEEACRGGATIVQYREKEGDTRELIESALKIKEVCCRYRVPFIVDDRVDVALAVDADGLHIGQTDMYYPQARKLLGKDKIIGLSVKTEAQALQASEWDVDYVGIGPVFPTTTKLQAADPIGWKGFSHLASLSKHPSVAIGGIKVDHVKDFLREVDSEYSSGIAVVSAIASADSPYDRAVEFRKGLGKV